MASKKITVTLDEGQVQQIRDLVAAGRAASVRVVTSDPTDLSLLDPTLELVIV